MLAIRLKYVLYFVLTLLIISVMIIARTDYSIRQQIREKSFAAPTEFFASPRKFYVGQIYKSSELTNYFSQQSYRQRDFGQRITAGDYAFGDREQCAQAIQISDAPHRCFTFRNKGDDVLYLILFNEWDAITHVYTGEDLEPQMFAAAEAIAFAQYLGDKPTLQKHVPLARIPRYCLDAVVAIEDPNFLTHSGVSVRGILRAVLANLRRGWGSQGGSTITQQLVKNYFLTPEKTITRKVKELLISLILEFRISKDDILETYLNIIYLGQQGVFEIRGYESASQHYFHRPVMELNLAQCSLLAALVNSPGRYNPFSKPEKAVERRTRVLNKMLEQKMITQEEFDLANRFELPEKAKKQLSATAPYFIDAVKRSLADKGVTTLAGLKVYTSLDLRAQRLAQRAVTNTIKYFEKGLASIKKIYEEGGRLQGVLISSNPLTGEISALVGGRSFATSPYNRAVESQRQVGSVFKPLVYLTALQNQQLESEEKYTPMTPLENSPFKYEYEGQSWEPRNYDRTFSGPVPLFFALKESMNVPTARLATQVGLDKIVDTARELGVESTLKPFPSLSLGAFELKPIEVLAAYTTISQFGKKRTPYLVKRVVDGLGNEIYLNELEEEQIGDPRDFAVLIGMMKETLISGTGQAAPKLGFNHFAAGKTGTTSDTKDAWFAGFTPYHTAVAWMGYDDGRSHGLTGASGALPIWVNYMKQYNSKYGNDDFRWPDGVKETTIPQFELEEFDIKPEKLKSTKLILRDRNYLHEDDLDDDESDEF